MLPLILAVLLTESELQTPLCEIHNFCVAAGLDVPASATNVTSIIGVGAPLSRTYVLEDTWAFTLWGDHKVHAYKDRREPVDVDLEKLIRLGKQKPTISVEEGSKSAERILINLGVKPESYDVKQYKVVTVELSPTESLKLPLLDIVWRKKGDPEYVSIRVMISLTTGRVIQLMIP